MNHNVFDLTLIEKYSTQGPRYTSYPTAVQFTDVLGANRFAELVDESNESGKDLSLYAHIPFCDSICYYCGCNKIVTSNKRRAAPYLDAMEKEMGMVAERLDSDRRVVQLHWGGGTPTFLSRQEQFRLSQAFRDLFHFVGDDEGEFSIEIDPRTVTPSSIADLREMGFNRLSFGIQDFDNRVQLAVNRIQSEDETRLAIEEGRRQGFHSISVDLIYGLPLQTANSFAKTIDKIIDLSPDRIAVFNYAHLPHIFKVQRRINDAQLPSGQEKLDLLEMSINRLMDAGYVFIGLDHFAKPDDSLVRHQQNGTLYRNFQGYSTFSACDLFGFGISSISQVGNSYSQNAKGKHDYFAAIAAGQFPTVRGVELSEDDRIRRKVITEIMCNMKLDFSAIGREFGIDADSYFEAEKKRLQPMHDDGLLVLNKHGFSVTAPGRLLIRNIAMIFDRYLPQVSRKTFSKVI
ncbi:MAG: oxygen-independent coproporphyrinogen III oxidase [Gammaproteobacteria bacterium]|nr:MAG: oxygen-independent coproporphyrinogen III oxidase [Gammaproteobacteria bacterium]